MYFAGEHFPRGPKIETKKALFLIDFQNDFVSPKGKLPVANTQDFIAKLPELVETFRANGQVVWVNTEFQRPCAAISPQTGSYCILLKQFAEQLKAQVQLRTTSLSPISEQDEAADTVPASTIDDDSEAFLAPDIPNMNSRCCVPHSDGAEMPPVLARCVDARKDVLLTKTGYSAFEDPMLIFKLRSRMITHLYMSGSLSNVGVYATVLDAVSQGFTVTLIEDCLGYRDDTCHVEAVSRLVDMAGAEGVDHQELMDDLNGMLGDVIQTSAFTRTFQLSTQKANPAKNQISHAQKVNEWMARIAAGSDEEEPDVQAVSKDGIEKRTSVPTENVLASQLHESSSVRTPAATRAYSPPPRKRSTGDRDDAETSIAIDRRESPPASSVRPTSRDSSIKDKPVAKRAKRESIDITAYASVPPSPERRSSTTSIRRTDKTSRTMESQPSLPRSTSLPVYCSMLPIDAGPDLTGPSTASKPTHTSDSTIVKSKRKLKNESSYLGPSDNIGDSDTTIHYEVMPLNNADHAFHLLSSFIPWQKMLHRTGEVPRLVAVQGNTDADGDCPIYRHPADQSPMLQPFDPNVLSLKKICEKLVGHELNHVLIQKYRSGDDNISEHSDKTLDIIRGSKIVNLSFGAQRTMTLRRKKATLTTESTRNADHGPTRETQRIQLPHASAFVLGLKTNANWLHAVRADKRLDQEKSAAELAYDGERISLTFRRIGTFLSKDGTTIWGQGATAKIKSEARPILQGKEAHKAGKEMIAAFGKENHLTERDFDWDKVYGKGFDVVNFTTKS